MSRRPAVSTDRGVSHTPQSATATNTALEARINDLEVTSEVVDMILAQPDLSEHLEIVLLYLEMDLIEWQSVLTLREGVGEHMRRFLNVHDSIQTTPPRPLFLLVKKLWSLFEQERQWAVVQIKMQTSQMQSSSSQPTRQASSSGVRTAPSGQSYRCPARGCHRTFVKLGHAENHVRKRHDEYLQLHPEYRPEHHLVSRPPSKPPQLEREASDSRSMAESETPSSSDKPRRSSRAVLSRTGSTHNPEGNNPASSVSSRQYPTSLLSRPRQSSTRSSSQSQHSSGNSSNNLDDSVLRQIAMMQPQTVSATVSSRHDPDAALFRNYEPALHGDSTIELSRHIQDRRHEQH